MGYNFETIIIRRTNAKQNEDLKVIEEYLSQKFEVFKKDTSHEEYLRQKWNNPRNYWVAVYADEETIIIDHESYPIPEQVVKEWSVQFNAETIMAMDSSTACVFVFSIFKNGELIRHNSSEAGMTYELPDGKTIHNPKAVGEVTEYELNPNGFHDTMGILQNFIGRNLSILDIQKLTIYKEK